MPVVVRIALRNLREHKIKSLIIGAIIGLGAAIMVVGGSLMNTATSGMEKAFVESYTGDFMISANANMSIFGVSGPGMDEPIPEIPDYPKLAEQVKNIPGVRSITPLLTGRAGASFREGDNVPVQLFGIDPESYRTMFPDDIEILSGRMLEPGEEGIVLSEKVAQSVEAPDGTRIRTGDSLLLSTSTSAAGFKIRKMTVRGIYRFIRSNQYLDSVSFIDADDLRIMLGMTSTGNEGTAGRASGTAAGEAETSSAQQTQQDNGEHDLFGGSLVQSGALAGTPDVFDILGDSAKFESRPNPTGWHMILVRVSDRASLATVGEEIRGLLAESQGGLHLEDWMTAAGPIGRIASAIRIVFVVVLIVVAVVALIVIMNTFVLSIIERIPEFGTMRAMGAQRGLVFRMILVEAATNSLLFGLAGIVLGVAVVVILGALGIAAPNEFYQVLFGGPILRPILSAGSIGEALAIVVLVGFAASLYPTALALRVRPAVAMGGK